jgi:DNA-binding MarR family transcriptional regulator
MNFHGRSGKTLNGSGTLQPQAWDVLNFLRDNPGQDFTGAEVASATGVDQNSVRGQLHSLLRKGLVLRIGGGRVKEGGGLGRKNLNTWQASARQG